MYENAVLITHAEMPLNNAHADVSKEARALIFCLILHLFPYLMHASSEDSGESAHMRRPACTLAARWYDKYQNLVHWLNYAVIFNICFIAGISYYNSLVPFLENLYVIMHV